MMHRIKCSTLHLDAKLPGCVIDNLNCYQEIEYINSSAARRRRRQELTLLMQSVLSVRNKHVVSIIVSVESAREKISNLPRNRCGFQSAHNATLLFMWCCRPLIVSILYIYNKNILYIYTKRAPRDSNITSDGRSCREIVSAIN